MIGFILASIGTLGIAGFIALAIFAPPIAAQVAKIAFTLLDQLLSTRWGVGLLSGAACLLFGYFYFDHVGAARVQAQWDKAKIEYAEKIEGVRIASKDEATQAVQDAAAQERVKTKDAEQRIAEYERQLAAKPDNACSPISDDDLAAADGRNVQPQRGSRNRLPFHRNSR